MVKQNSIKVFEEKKVRTLWDSETEEWYFSVVDVVAVLTDSENPRRYWSDLKRKLLKEGSQLYEGIVQLKNDFVRREILQDRCSHNSTTFPPYPIHPITQSRTIQIMDGTSGCGTT